MAGGRSCTPDTDWSAARAGISLILNDKPKEAEAVFANYPQSLHVQTGRCFVVFMDALLTQEQDKLRQAMLLLKDLERECASNIGWLKSMKSMVFRAEETDKEYVTKLDRQIALADSQLCMAVLNILRMDVPSLVRCGWLLRKAWRVYQHAYAQILQLYRRTFGSDPSGFRISGGPSSCGRSADSMQSPQSPGSSEWSIPSCKTPATSPSGLRSSLSMFLSLTGITSEQQTPFVEPTEVARLMSAVSLGYGIFQLTLSLLPPDIFKVMQCLGFEGDREAGLAALMHARLSEDMRAPLATVALLWYHTAARPYYAVDGSNINAGVASAKLLIDECRTEFQNSALFLGFMGRIERLESNVDAAVRTYKKAIDVSTQREVKVLCLHELVWCHLNQLSYSAAFHTLVQLIPLTATFRCFYAYVAAVCCGANGTFEILSRFNRKFANWSRSLRVDQPIHVFVLRRMPKLVHPCTRQPFAVSYYRLLIYELLYLWNALQCCSSDCLRGILSDCKGCTDEPMAGLADFIEGAAYFHIGEKHAAIECFRSCLAKRNSPRDAHDQHISAFALYELGNALCDTNNIEEGKSVLLKARSQYEDYDFHPRLLMRVHFTLSTLR